MNSSPLFHCLGCKKIIDDNVDASVQCDKCDGWVHQECAGTFSVDDDFYCSRCDLKIKAGHQNENGHLRYSGNASLTIQSENKTKRRSKPAVKSDLKKPLVSIAEEAHNNKLLFSHHIRIEKDEETNTPYYECNSCDQFPATIHKLLAQKHAVAHNNTKPKIRKKQSKKYKCSICDYECLGKVILNKHFRETHQTKQELCSDCGGKFNDRKILRRHIQDVHMKLKRLTCNVCNYSCRDKFDLDHHRRKNHEKNELDSSNNEINEGENSNIEEIEIEINEGFSESVHNNGDSEVIVSKSINIQETFICDTCQKSFKNKRSYEIHLKAHDPSTWIQCDQCDKQFSVQYKLTRHKKTHYKEKNLKCDKCNKFFRDKYNYDRHIQKHKPKVELKCDKCPYVSKNPLMLLKHNQKYHSGNYNKENNGDLVNKDEQLGNNDLNVDILESTSANHIDLPQSNTNEFEQIPEDLSNILLDLDCLPPMDINEINQATEDLSNVSFDLDCLPPLNINEINQATEDLCNVSFDFDSFLKSDIDQVNNNNNHVTDLEQSKNENILKSESKGDNIAHNIKTIAIPNPPFAQKIEQPFLIKLDSDVINETPFHEDEIEINTTTESTLGSNDLVNCDICTTLVQKKWLKSHKDKLHGESVQCEKCKIIFLDKSSFIIHTPCSAKWQCVNCNKTFVEKSYFLQHKCKATF